MMRSHSGTTGIASTGDNRRLIRIFVNRSAPITSAAMPKGHSRATELRPFSTLLRELRNHRGTKCAHGGQFGIASDVTLVFPATLTLVADCALNHHRDGRVRMAALQKDLRNDKPAGQLLQMALQQ